MANNEGQLLFSTNERLYRPQMNKYCEKFGIPIPEKESDEEENVLTFIQGARQVRFIEWLKQDLLFTYSGKEYLLSGWNTVEQSEPMLLKDIFSTLVADFDHFTVRIDEEGAYDLSVSYRGDGSAFYKIVLLRESINN